MSPSREQKGTPQVGRRPPDPRVLLLTGAMWIAAGIYALARLSAGWKLIPGIVFIGVGLLFLRGAAAAILRRDERNKR